MKLTEHQDLKVGDYVLSYSRDDDVANLFYTVVSSVVSDIESVHGLEYKFIQVVYDHVSVIKDLTTLRGFITLEPHETHYILDDDEVIEYILMETI